MPSRAHPEAPPPLNLARLAAGAPGTWVTLPGAEVRVLALDAKQTGLRASGWLVCLTGEALIDLSEGDFVRLRASEAHRLTPADDWEALPVKAATVLMLVPDESGR
ncbi:hypothetical protein [Deinococcus sp. QL22]|uniref:hypothetical protein n=1 Tax=Deinococcus sp. QL22 TaxID=2939437 RepID=UPI0020176695|nr:hypothetical protein [Deinococcus sp. QL22]UQN05285.1 hypothetical protein M1R55_10340 [Deinococcus sp. QL22]